jgi:hypothetical protein
MVANLRIPPCHPGQSRKTPKQPSPGPKVARAISLSRPCELITPAVPGRKSAIRETGLKRWPGVQPADPKASPFWHREFQQANPKAVRWSAALLTTRLRANTRFSRHQGQVVAAPQLLPA